MKLGTHNRKVGRAAFAVSTALASILTLPSGLYAQEAPHSEIADIVVTAQKREQNLQDVPLAVTAVTQESLEANRITNVSGLSGLAPGLTIRATTGGSNIPSISMRGLNSFGSVPGQDKEISIYLDGVFISSTRGSLFELPDIARIEVLRGPQGTLFGRNSTAGAISIVTREPTGEFGFRQDLTVGNRDQFRSRTTVDLPAWGPFSAYVTYVHDEKRGDIRNLGAGAVWDRTGPKTHFGRNTSPKWLGSKNLDSVFAAVRFQPSDEFKLTYKYDYAINHFTPSGTVPTVLNSQFPSLGPVLTALVDYARANPGPFGPIYFDPTSARRPDAANNMFATVGTQRNSGHSLTAELELTDNLSVKDILAYRKYFNKNSSQISGLGGLYVPPLSVTMGGRSIASILQTLSPALNGGVAIPCQPQPACLVGQPVAALDPQGLNFGNQFSNEIQFNYQSDLITLTAGALYFRSHDLAGGPPGMPASWTLMVIPNGRVPLGNQSRGDNTAESFAAYIQPELHVTPNLDIIGGARITHDKKTGTFLTRGIFVPAVPGSFEEGTFINEVRSSFIYEKSKPTYMLGMNFRPNEDIMLYAKGSTGFVSGGSVGGFDFTAETVKSAEVGLKADWLDRRLRTNIALWIAKYKDIQSVQAAASVGRAELGTVIISGFDKKAQGVEVEVTALPVEGLTLSGSFGYTKTKLSNVAPLQLASQAIRPFETSARKLFDTFIPKWTANLSAVYETQPIIGDAHLMFRADATGRSRMRVHFNADYGILQPTGIQFAPEVWTINGRVALRDIDVGGAKVELALWGRNLTDDRDAYAFPTNLGALQATSYEPARTYGIDLSIRY